MSVGQQGADLNNEGNRLVQEVRVIVAKNPSWAVHLRDNPPGTYSVPSTGMAHIQYAQQLAAYRQPIQLWRNAAQGFLQEHAEELWASWPEIAQQLDRTFDNSTYALEYAVGAELWTRTATQGLLPSLIDETQKAARVGGGIAVGAIFLIFVLWISLR